MKKLLVLFAFALFGYTATAQGVFKIGATAGVAVSDAGDVADWALGVDAYYMIEKVDAVINFGPTIGFRNFFMSVDGVDDAQFLPIAGAARLKLFGILSGGVDVGYALGISDYLDGGFYYRPTVGIDIADAIELNASFESISDAATWGNLNVGILFEF
ncbi:hypothetical protein SAMN04515667_1699 [Formosa sp. Hel1_31_208]|uniref:hypothetical protein n=1 Tax=Formosa sp. Hel1_31_208 TaxID=1798225 RepID=UPI00087A44FD|nr:hypothetical protein [Formosa sp. Hel1_31_208]SDS22793.1 hypothetical protein SAMN04515667_1699 [Formosa sp. Hel1_31_208]